MKATGIVRRIDDLGRVVIPKEIRRTMRIREGDPLEIYTTREGDAIIAIAGSGKRELMGKQISAALEQLMEERSIYRSEGVPTVPVTDGSDKYTVAVAAPILCGGDVLGLVLFLTGEGQTGGETEHKLAQTVAAFLGRHMEG